VRGGLDPAVLVLALAVIFWVAGFDVLYSLQDEEFDRQAGLFSLPARLGAVPARRLAAGFHLTAAALFALTGFLADLGAFYAVAVLLSGLIMAVQHIRLCTREPLRLPPAFFTLNGLVGLGLALATWVSLAS
jgi:4-hydroxybenzoate polyprenyltransferase